MNSTTTNNLKDIHFGHLALIISVFVFLVGATWLKEPEIFKLNKSSNNNISNSNLPSYYAYETPAELNQPLVAGASTEGQGPMIIGEDGSLNPAVDIGEVLGTNTSESLDLSNIYINEILDSKESHSLYISQIETIEGKYLDLGGLETILSSGDQSKINSFVESIKSLISELSIISVPESFNRFHKLKIKQYQAGLIILQNFTQIDSNPEYINSQLDIFLKAEKDLQQEAGNIVLIE